MIVDPRGASKQPLQGLSAVALSLGLHGAVIGAVAVGQHGLPEKHQMAQTRLAGQTFDVDALGQPVDPEASVPEGQDTPASIPENVTGADSEIDAPVRDGPVLDAAPQPEPEPEPEEDAAPTDPSPEDNPTEAAPVDPFDLEQLPGEATRPDGPPDQAGPATETTTGAYGAKGIGDTTVDVFATLLRQLPLAAKSDPAWTQLPEGDAGRVEFTVSVSANGRLGPVEIVEDEQFPAPAHLKRAVPLALRFFQHARARLDAEGEAGSQRLALVATVHRRPPDLKTPDAPGVRAFGLKGGDRPTGVYFTYFSGHHIEIQMWRLP